jgi:hypothetical protein
LNTKHAKRIGAVSRNYRGGRRAIDVRRRNGRSCRTDRVESRREAVDARR